VAGTLVAHAVAYAAFGAPAGDVHGYLAHLPQLVTILALPALLLAAVAGRAATPRAWPFAAAALVAFVLQEHLERVIHTGELPFLLDRPVFLLGLVLQVPFALVAWLLARGVSRVAVAFSSRAPRSGSSLLLPLPRPPALALRTAALRGSGSPRGPPAVLPTR
jgi:hypothetical protein